MGLNDPYDSPGYYQDSAPYANQLHRFEHRSRPKPVDASPKLREAFLLKRKNWTLAHEANPREERGYQTLIIPDNHLVWKGKCWDAAERNEIPCYFTNVDGTVFYFTDFMEEGAELEQISTARAFAAYFGQKISDLR